MQIKNLSEFLVIKKIELIGKNHKIFKHPQTSNEFYEDLWSTILSGKIWKGV